MFTLIRVSRNPHTHTGWSDRTPPYRGRQSWGSDREGAYVVWGDGADWECRESSCRPWDAGHPQRQTELSPRDPAPYGSPLLVARCRPWSPWCAIGTPGDMGSSQKHFGTQNTSRTPQAPAPNPNPKMGPKKGASSER